jgi:Golgi apparatus protein 1
MRTALVLALFASFALPARADDPCAQETVALCNKAVGTNAVLGCLRGNQEKLSPACKANVSELTAIAEEYGDDCRTDAQKFCANVPPGQGRIARCLVDNASFVSASCQSAMNKVRLIRSEITASCAGDVGQFCQMVPEGAGRILACLRKHHDKLSRDCKDVLKKLP